MQNSPPIDVIKAEIEQGCVRTRGRPRDEVARARILDAALELLEQQGFANTTSDAIAERAGASKATIYRWWPNKAAVLIEALREAVAQELPQPDTGDLRLDVQLQLRNFIEILTGRRGLAFKAFIAAAQNDPEVAEAFRELWIRPRRRHAIEILQRHQKEGRLSKDVSPETVLDLLYGPFYFRLLAGHAPLSDDFADQVSRLALNGLSQSGLVS